MDHQNFLATHIASPSKYLLLLSHDLLDRRSMIALVAGRILAKTYETKQRTLRIMRLRPNFVHCNTTPQILVHRSNRSSFKLCDHNEVILDFFYRQRLPREWVDQSAEEPCTVKHEAPMMAIIRRGH
ncbi:hypothetical protein PAXRUDRAFT_244649 [Paxillus rubicundulus Ve08.2h10]|uniref:Uncharacterized protein n=1 Tax=Paxillus rubicundulus Ve08.2h10 TaxID=930991 RepID=A0A0D0E6P5_9AGAM|nr:hypothetical protein PAXRUDRAFT_244649 [Paxillus rubicundulus Ve08.2h10]